MNQPTAILFDLDDTLYDHLYSARHGLIELHRRCPAIGEGDIRELEERYSEALESVHVRLLRGEVTQREARTLRMKQLFRAYGVEIDSETAMGEYRQFRSDYDSVSQVVAGTHELLGRLQELGFRLAVVTNNLVAEQIPKLKRLNLERYFEVVSISEAVGVAKPDVRIFDATLQKLCLKPAEVVMVGDSLSSDIEGARRAGMRSVWLKRRADSPVAPPEGVATIVGDFSDWKSAANVIVNAWKS